MPNVPIVVADGTGTTPTLAGMLSMMDQTPPITSAQFQVWYSLWPRTLFFTQDVPAIGINNKTLSLYHAGVEVPLIMNTVCNSQELTMNILDDEFAVNYTWWRNATIIYGSDGMKGRPILDAFEPNADGVYQGSGYIIVKQCNDPASRSQHVWRFHNFKPTKVSDIAYAQNKTDFTSFEITGVFTHITYVQDPQDKVALNNGASAPVKEIVQAPAEAPEQPPLVGVGGVA